MEIIYALQRVSLFHFSFSFQISFISASIVVSVSASVIMPATRKTIHNVTMVKCSLCCQLHQTNHYDVTKTLKTDNNAASTENSEN